MVTAPVPHRDDVVPVGEAGNVFTVAVTAILVINIQLVAVFLAPA